MRLEVATIDAFQTGSSQRAMHQLDDYLARVKQRLHFVLEGGRTAIVTDDDTVVAEDELLSMMTVVDGQKLRASNDWGIWYSWPLSKSELKQLAELGLK